MITEAVIKKFTDKIHERMVDNMAMLDEAYNSVEGKEKLDVSIPGHFSPGKEGAVQIKGSVNFAPARIKMPFDFQHNPNQNSLDFEGTAGGKEKTGTEL